jgi:hypothetical protein
MTVNFFKILKVKNEFFSEETIKPQIQEPQNSEAQESASAAQVETIPQQVESSQVEDRVQADRQSESQSEEKMETSIVPPPIQNDGDSSDEDEGRPTRKIVIDEDDDGEPVVRKAPEPAQEAPKGLPYEVKIFFKYKKLYYCFTKFGTYILITIINKKCCVEQRA